MKSPLAPWRVRPLSPARWRDLEVLFGPRGACAGCWCMWWRRRGAEWRRGRGDGNRRALRRVVESGAPSGLIAYRGGEPVGWCAVAPREHYPRLEHSRTLARVDDRPVWSVPCFFVARPFRRGGLTKRLLREAVKFAASQGARTVEGYPIDLRGGKTLADAWAYTGFASAFRAAGFREVARRSRSRPIMRRALRAAWKARPLPRAAVPVPAARRLRPVAVAATAVRPARAARGERRPAAAGR